MSTLLINLALAAIAIIFFCQFLVSKKHSKKQLDAEIKARQNIELKYQNEIESLRSQSAKSSENNNKSMLDSLILEVETLRKEKDEELKSRLETEKEVDLAIQKTHEVQKRIDDWKIIQEANLRDAINTISGVGNDLYQKLIVDYKLESEAIGNRVDNTVKNIYDYLEKIVKQVQFLNIHNVDSKTAVKAAIGIHNSTINTNINSRNLEDILKSAHLHSGIDYFMHHDLPEEIQKSVLCETMVTISKENVIIIDIKSNKFFLELFSDQSRKNPDSENIFQQKMDRYLTYLTNPKYLSNIINYFSKQNVISANNSNALVMLVPSQKEIDAFNNLGKKYLKTLQDNNIQLHSLKTFSNLIIGE